MFTEHIFQSDNGTFSIDMDKGESNIDYAEAFEIIPDSGYQKADFTITVKNSSLLDYEDENWKIIKLHVSYLNTFISDD